MKIAEIVSGRAVNGAVMHVARLAPALVGHGHDVTVVCRPGSWIAERLSREPVTVLACDLRRRPDRLRALSRVIGGRRFDVMHTHMSSAHAFGALLRLGTGVPVVATAHSCRLQLHWTLNDHVICVSEHVARFQRRFNRVRAERLSVIHPFVECTGSTTDPAARAGVRREFGAAADTCVIGCVGSVFKEKGVHDLIAALPEVAASSTPIRLVIVGDGPADYRARLQRDIERSKLAALVHWAGPRFDVACVLDAVDLLAIPTHNESLSTIALEAMAAGTAVVATRVGGIPECVVDEETGLLVPPSRPEALATALRRLVEDPGTRDQLVMNARRRMAERFSPDAQVAKNEAVLDRVALI